MISVDPSMQPQAVGRHQQGVAASGTNQAVGGWMATSIQAGGAPPETRGTPAADSGLHAIAGSVIKRGLLHIGSW